MPNRTIVAANPRDRTTPDTGRTWYAVGVRLPITLPMRIGKGEAMSRQATGTSKTIVAATNVRS